MAPSAGSVQRTFNREIDKHLSDPFWGTSPEILTTKLKDFFPTSAMSQNEKLNSISRFFIYFSLILTVIYFNLNYIFIGIVGLAFIWFIHYMDQRSHLVNVETFDSDVKKVLGIAPETPVKILDNGDVCQRPTKDNPFMNVLLTDYTDNPNRPPACPYKESKQEIEDNFNVNL